MIPADDRGLLLGDGLFETLLARSGELVELDAHLERMAAGCAVLGLPALDKVEAAALMRAAVAAAGLEGARAAVRLTLTAGSGGRGLDRPDAPAPRLLASAAFAAAVETPVRLATSPIRRNPDSPAARLKTLAYLDNVLARRQAVAAGADEALMLNTRGELACAAAANLFWLRDGRLFTPALECGVLAGITRAAVIAAAAGMGVAVEQVAVGRSALEGVEAAFLTNSLIGVRPAAELDGRPLGGSPLVERLARALA